jgi:hypothetical protein
MLSADVVVGDWGVSTAGLGAGRLDLDTVWLSWAGDWPWWFPARRTRLRCDT